MTVAPLLFTPYTHVAVEAVQQVLGHRGAVICHFSTRQPFAAWVAGGVDPRQGLSFLLELPLVRVRVRVRVRVS